MREGERGRERGGGEGGGGRERKGEGGKEGGGRRKERDSKMNESVVEKKCYSGW